MDIKFSSIAFQLPLISFIIAGIIAIIYLGKNFGIKKENNYENKIFDYILVSTLIYSLTNTALHIFCSLNTLEDLNTIYFSLVNDTNKFLMGLLVTISQCLFMYVLVISYKKVKQNFYKYAFYMLVIFLVFVALIAFSEIELIFTGTSYNVKGYMPNVAYIFVGTTMFAATIINMMNFNKDDKRFFVMLYILIIGTLLIVLSIFIPGIIIYDFGLVLICFIMFHTIENPDLKLIYELNVAKNEADRANNAKSDFLSSMSHEIRTPLNAIIGLSTNIVDSEKLAPELREDAEDIVYASNTLLDIVGNVMDISKIERQKMEIVNEEYNFNEIVEETIKLNEHRLKGKPIKISLNLDKSIPYLLYGDKIHMKQIVNNLISNSIKYTDKGTVKISAYSKNKDKKSTIYFKVEDTGRGIKKDLINKLFDKFERLGAEKNSTTEGTGLGLAITKELVELLNGKINVQSSYGYGSTFTVQIPQVIVSLEKDYTGEVCHLTDNSVNLSGKRVLVVDDNLLNIKVAVRALTPLNVEIDTCTSGIECLVKVKDKDYDIILMDIMMPEMGGVETLHKLKENPKFNTPVVALTADAVGDTKNKYLKEGFNEYVSKPFNKEHIKKVLEKLLEGK